MWDPTMVDEDHIIKNLPEDCRIIGGQIAYVGSMVAKLDNEIWRYENIIIPREKAKYLIRYRGQHNPTTGKVYTEADIDAIRHTDSVFINLREEQAKIMLRRDTLKAHLSALHTKKQSLTNVVDLMKMNQYSEMIIREEPK